MNPERIVIWTQENVPSPMDAATQGVMKPSGAVMFGAMTIGRVKAKAGNNAMYGRTLSIVPSILRS